MNKQDDGGSAFPAGLYAEDVATNGGRYDGTYVNRYEPIDGGMSLRDYFAAKALPAVIVQCREDTRNTGETLVAYFARKSYELADAMLKERQS
jgi:hypothetical protein